MLHCAHVVSGRGDKARREGDVGPWCDHLLDGLLDGHAPRLQALGKAGDGPCPHPVGKVAMFTTPLHPPGPWQSSHVHHTSTPTWSLAK